MHSIGDGGACFGEEFQAVDEGLDDGKPGSRLDGCQDAQDAPNEGLVQVAADAYDPRTDALGSNCKSALGSPEHLRHILGPTLGVGVVLRRVWQVLEVDDLASLQQVIFDRTRELQLIEQLPIPGGAGPREAGGSVYALAGRLLVLGPGTLWVFDPPR